MSIAQLKIDGFRNLQPVRLRVAEDTRVMALVGPNGAGKTSALEAVSLLGGGRGLLGAEARMQVGHGGKSWHVWAETGDGVPVAAGFAANARKTLVEQRPATAGQMAAALPVIWLAPRLDRLFYEGPGDRRGWLDEQAVLVQPRHAELVSRYQQHKRGRLKLLRDGRGAGDWIDAEERLMAEAGLALLHSRMAFLEQLNGVAAGVRLQLAGSALEILQEEDPTAALQGKFARSRDIDARLERTHAGPDTLDVTGAVTVAEGNDIALAQASSGQHKRALVRLVLALARLVHTHDGAGRAPVVLIDELGAHLDAQARAAVLDELTALGCQVWVSDTEMATDVQTRAGVRVVRVTGGTVHV